MTIEKIVRNMSKLLRLESMMILPKLYILLSVAKVDNPSIHALVWIFLFT